MTKNFFGGATINSGPTLPLITETPDGSLFYKTSAPSGLYFYGFNPDANGGLLGDQSTQGWTLLVDTSGAQPYVLRAGDTMLGSLEIPEYLRITQTAGAQRILIGNQNSGGVNRPSMIVGVNGTTQIGTGNTWGGNGGTFTAGLVVDPASVTGLTFLGGTVWHSGNDGAGSGLDADLLDGQQGAFYSNLANSTGILPVARGGTGSSAGLVTGGVLYGASPSLAATTVAGNVGQLFRSNGGASAPSWVDASTLSVAQATIAGFANTAGSAASADSVAWTGITGLTSSFQTFANAPLANSTTYARPSLFYNFGLPTSPTLAPDSFPPHSLSGFDAYSSTDLGDFQVGLTVVGTGSRAFQLSANWNFEEAVPTGLRYRVNDDTSTIGAWGATATLWDTGNFNPINYVAKSGDTMTGNLALPAIAVGSISMPPTGGINASGNITVLGFVSASNNVVSNGGNVIASNGNVQAGGVAGSGFGYTRITNGTALGASGEIQFWTGADVRGARIGNVVNSAPSTDAGVLEYVAASHLFTGSIVASGNITAFSDRRLKSNIVGIADALYKVQRLEGVTFNRKGSEERATGLIAQDVEAVLPEAVVTDTDGMKSVAYGNMVGLLVQAIKEQQEQIEALQRQVAALG